MCKAKELNDLDILAAMACGEIVIVDGLTTPRLFVKGRENAARLNEQGGRRRIHGSTRYRFTIRYCGKRRSIMRSRLNWLWHYGAIAADHHVHHGPNGRYDDGLFNLESLHIDDHHAEHYGESTADETPF